MLSKDTPTTALIQYHHNIIEYQLIISSKEWSHTVHMDLLINNYFYVAEMEDSVLL